MPFEKKKKAKGDAFPDTVFFEEQVTQLVSQLNIRRHTAPPVSNIRRFIDEQNKANIAEQNSVSARDDQSLSEQSEDLSKSLHQIIEEGTRIETVQKQDVRNEEVTQKEQEIIEKRIKHQQIQYKEFEKRINSKKLKSIKQVHEYVTDEEALMVLDECGGDEEEAISLLTDLQHLIHTRHQIAKQYSTMNSGNGVNNNSNHAQPKGEDMEVDEEQDDEYQSKKKRNRRGTKRKREEDASEEKKEKKEDESDSESEVSEGGTRKKKKKITIPKLKLDDAIAQGHTEGWSGARMRAWKLRDENPNAYYYRFNEPGEIQRNGKWTEAEKKAFFQRMNEVGVNGQWGIFSKAIYGRVGYQCANFYRQLIECGEITDNRYAIDENGKAHFIFPSKRKGEGDKESKTDEPKVVATPTQSTAQPGPAKKKRKVTRSTGDEDGDDRDYRPSLKKKKQRVEPEEDAGAAVPEEEADVDNPLPGYIDPITFEEVQKPAISPYGHVLGYQTWLKSLLQDPKNTCPITKQPLNKRDLVLLTWENIDQYRDKIIHL